MKKFTIILLNILLTFSYSTLQAQDENYPWQFSFGINAVDLDADTSTSFNEFFDIDENWNVSSARSIWSGFEMEQRP
jgi:hypothetical protein